MSDIHSTEEAYERIAEALNYLEGHGAEIMDVSVYGAIDGQVHRVLKDLDSGKWFVNKYPQRIRES
ncbi:hypothetical protein [Streptomyces griseosporeus]|uniref:hypothetical protein n=1 Tax=Streptomyces griseosporeus TaxID=1910 RepID=UPI00167E35FD|nr:hypothetical protein [Streptomyces griseosporeus]GHF92293.1 hypothetical protein GCM10018783_73970 [Streptomyces griseosporeus]